MLFVDFASTNSGNQRSKSLFGAFASWMLISSLILVMILAIEFQSKL